MKPGGSGRGREDSLYKPITAAAAVVVLLELDELELAKGLEDILEILLGDAEVDVADVETVKGDGIGMIAAALSIANLTVLLGFGKLDNNRDT